MEGFGKKIGDGVGCIYMAGGIAIATLALTVVGLLIYIYVR
jgi:hypothetical protein